ncbi:MAG: hypothetical protein HYY93_02225 [Planctomycetes bacterium]|nr:hypothetical protein [Planctomycetota bacterium]
MEQTLKAATVVSSADVKATDAKGSAKIPAQEWGSDGDKPILLFLSWPHEDAPVGGDCEKLCKNTFDDEDLARATKLFVCVKIDAKATDQNLLKEMGIKSFPSLAVADGQGNIVARLEKQTSSSKVASALYSTIQSRLPKYYQKIQQIKAEQARAFDQGKNLAKAKKYQDAIAKFESITNSDVRGDLFEKAMKELTEAQTKAAKASNNG